MLRHQSNLPSAPCCLLTFTDVQEILHDGDLVIKQVRESSRSQLVSVLMHGVPGSGKTALAATIAMKSKFPFIKLVSAENMIGYTESAKIGYLNKVFSDSYKSPMSVVVVDSIERIIGEWWMMRLQAV